MVLLLSSCSLRKHIPEDKMILKKNKVKIESKDVDFTKYDISKYIAQSENEKILGFMPLTWVYYKTDDKPNNKIISWINKEVGVKPVYYNSELQDRSMIQITNYLNNIGYFNSGISVEPKNRKGILKLVYKIYPSQPYIIDEITYQINDITLAKYVEEIQAQLPVQTGDIYNAFELDDMRDVITEQLKNNGYYYFTQDYISVGVDTNFNAHKANINIIISDDINSTTQEVKKHKQYYINNIFIYPKGIPNINIIPDTLQYTYELNKRLGDETYNFVYSGNPRIRFKTFENLIQIKSGQLYNINSVSQTYKSLNNLKIFNLNNIDFKPITHTNDSINLLDCNIMLNRSKTNYYSVQFEGTLAGGEPGVATSFTYRNKNIFKGSEIFNINIRYGIQRQRYNDENGEISIFRTQEFGIEGSLLFPKVVPFKLNNSRKDFQPRTTLTVGYNKQSRPIYLRQTTILTYGYNWMPNKYIQHIFTPITFNSVKVDPTPSFETILEQETNQRIKDQYTSHLIFGIDYTYIYTNQDINLSNDFFYIKTNLQSSGNLLSLLNKTPLVKTVDNYHEIFGIRYAQYARISIDFRYFNYINEAKDQIATRFMVGLGIPYGNSNDMPFEKSFYAGGSNGMRGWRFRELGPGTYNNSENINIECIGDIQLEMNFEYRYTIEGALKGAIFTDIGNIWTMRENETFIGGQFKFNTFYKQLAVDAGLGLRLDIGSFLLLRVDAAIPIVNPIYPEGERWRISKLQFKDFVIHFGIGYPF